MKYEESICTICSLEKERCVYNNPNVKVIKSSEEDIWIVALHRHTILPMTGEIKCLKNAVKKIFPTGVEIDKFPAGQSKHMHWIVKGIPRFKALK